MASSSQPSRWLPFFCLCLLWPLPSLMAIYVIRPLEVDELLALQDMAERQQEQEDRAVDEQELTSRWLSLQQSLMARQKKAERQMPSQSVLLLADDDDDDGQLGDFAEPLELVEVIEEPEEEEPEEEDDDQQQQQEEEEEAGRLILLPRPEGGGGGLVLLD